MHRKLYFSSINISRVRTCKCLGRYKKPRVISTCWHLGALPNLLSQDLHIYVLRKVGIGAIPELHLRKVGIPTLSADSRIVSDTTIQFILPKLHVLKIDPSIIGC